MADESGSTTFTFKANTKPAEESLDNFGDKVISVGKTVGVALAAYFSFSAIKNTLDKAITAAMESDKAVKELNNSLAITGQFTQQASENFQRFASEMQRSTGISDEVIMRGASTLVTVGKIQVDQLERITKATVDFAAARRIDASEAFEIMTKAANGNVAALSKYGLAVKDAGSANEKFSETLKLIEGRFSGLAAANMDPFQKLKVSSDEFFESIGKQFTQSSKFKAVLIILGEALDSISSKMEGLKGSKNIIDGLIDSFFRLGQVFIDNFLRPFEKFSNFLSLTFMASISNILQGLGLLGMAIDKLFKTNIAESINQTAQQWRTATELMAVDAVNGATTMSDVYAEKLTKVQEKVNETAATIKDKIPEAAAATVEAAGSEWDLMANVFQGAFKRMEVTAKSFSDTIRSSVAGGIQNALAGVGRALVQGGNAFQAFAGAALSALGQVAIQMGMMLILAGSGWALIPGFQASSGAIAYGAALVILGGALQAIAGSMQQSSGTAPGASGIGVGGSTSAFAGGVGNTEPTTPEERVTPQTGVQVIVQGNILNTRESALEIAEVLNNAFDTNGTYIRATG